MAEHYHLWYCSAMSYYDDIYEIAVDNHYLVSTADARGAGVPAVELAKLASRGKLEHVARGLYRLARYVPDGGDPYAVAVARVGGGAYLYGESVVALLGLAPTSPDRIWVATPRRVRLKEPPAGLRIVRGEPGYEPTAYEGVPSQRAADAIASCLATMMPERVEQAADEALRQGYVTPRERGSLAEALGVRA